MNIRIDNDLAAKFKDIARCNGLSVASYVNGLLESALNGELALAKSQSLEEKRRKVIYRLWETHEFLKNVRVIAHDGWESVGGDKEIDFTKRFDFTDITDSFRPFHKGTVRVTFKGKSTKPTHVSFRDCDGNDL